MIGKHNIEGILLLANIVSDIIPENYQEKYNKEVFGQKMTFKDQFIAYCISNSFTPKTTNEELLKAEVLGFINKYRNVFEKSKSKFKYDIFDHLFLSFIPPEEELDNEKDERIKPK